MNRKGFDSRIAQFQANQSRFEEIVARVAAKQIPDPARHHIVASGTNYVAFRSPAEYKDIVPYLIAANWEEDGTLTVRCVLCCYFPNNHHRGYMYRPDGRFKPYFRSWERMNKVINTNWAVIHD
jgi:hypothetical protein